MRDDRQRLLDILEAIDRIDRYASRGRQAFDADELIQSWVVHHLEIVGEACRSVTPEFERAHPEIPWSAIVGMRNILIHQYFGIDRDAVWAAVEGDLRSLRAAVQRILEDEAGRG